MRILRFAILALVPGALALGGCSTCGASPAATAPPPEPAALTSSTLRLDNGLVVDLLTGPCDGAAAVALVLDVGADHDPPDRSGLVHVLTRALSAQAGEGVSIGSGADHTRWSRAVSSAALSRALDEAAAVLGGLEVGAEGLERARREVLDEIAAQDGGDPSQTAAARAAESVRPSRGGSPGAVAREVAAITEDELTAFAGAHFTAGNARLVVVGELDPASARAEVERALARLAAGAATAAREPGTARVTGTVVLGDAPSALALAVPAPAPSDPAYPALLVVAARLIEAGAAPRVWEAEHDPVERPDLLSIRAPVQPGEPAEALAERVRAEAAALASRPLGAADLVALRERYGAFLGLHDEDPARCAEDPRRLALARARRTQLRLERVALDAITQAQLDEAASALAPRRSAAVIAGGASR